jgi:hypothetical protein
VDARGHPRGVVSRNRPRPRWPPGRVGKISAHRAGLSSRAKSHARNSNLKPTTPTSGRVSSPGLDPTQYSLVGEAKETLSQVASTKRFHWGLSRLVDDHDT